MGCVYLLEYDFEAHYASISLSELRIYTKAIWFTSCSLNCPESLHILESTGKESDYQQGISL